MTAGSSRLDPDQQEWFEEKYGVRYYHVQDNADIASRKQRRAAKWRRRRRPDGKEHGG
jgi:hypothetical protein